MGQASISLNKEELMEECRKAKDTAGRIDVQEITVESINYKSLVLDGYLEKTHGIGKLVDAYRQLIEKTVRMTEQIAEAFVDVDEKNAAVWRES